MPGQTCQTVFVAALAICLLIPAIATAQDFKEDGWLAQTPEKGRISAYVHKDSLAWMTTWKVAVPDTDLVGFRERIETHLGSEGYVAKGEAEVVVKDYPAVERTYTKQIDGYDVTLIVVEVYTRGVFWHFAGSFRPSEALSAESMRKSLLSMAATNFK